MMRVLSRPCHPFLGPLVTILDFEALIQGIIKSKHLLEGPITLGMTSLRTPSAILGRPGGHFDFAGGGLFLAV